MILHAHWKKKHICKLEVWFFVYPRRHPPPPQFGKIPDFFRIFFGYLSLLRGNVNHIFLNFEKELKMHFQANGVGGSFGGRGCWGTWGDQCKCCFSALTRTPLSSLSPLSGGQSNPDCFVFYQNSQKNSDNVESWNLQKSIQIHGESALLNRFNFPSCEPLVHEGCRWEVKGWEGRLPSSFPWNPQLRLGWPLLPGTKDIS